MNAELFKDMIAGFAEAKKYRTKRKAKLRVSRLAFEPVKMKPAQIRRIRIRLQLSQPEFADFLCTSVGTIRSWEQGNRSPNRSALRLLVIAKEQPALLLQRRA
jgi:DNA-binding transcriptional regulator YiaG